MNISWKTSFEIWKQNQELIKLLREKERFIDAQEAELRQWETWGIVEIAVRNPNVSEYINHWEGRALKAEKEAQEWENSWEVATKHNRDQDVVMGGLRRERDALREQVKGLEERVKELENIIEKYTPAMVRWDIEKAAGGRIDEWQ